VNKRQGKKKAKLDSQNVARILAFTLTNDRRHVSGLSDNQIIAFYKKLFPQKGA
jgi:hypothetical protein